MALDIARDIRGKDFAREARFDRASVDPKARTVELAFSSEAPYRRFWGVEVLSHDLGAADLSRLNDGANLLINHDWDDYVGVVESARIDDDRKGRALVRFGSGARAQEVWQDVQDGILRSVSVGYKIDDMILTRSGEDGDEYTVTHWTPYEISLVTVPADQSAKVGRAHDPLIPADTAKQPEVSMTEKAAQAAPSAETRSDTIQSGVDHAAVEKARTDTIRHVCQMADIDEGTATSWVLEGVTIQEAQGRAMEVLAARHKDFKRAASNVGMSRKEIAQYSIFRMIEAVGNKNPGRAGLEHEVHQELQRKLNRLPNEESFFLPSDRACVLQPVERGARDPSRTFLVPGEILSRDLTAGVPSAGGYLVETANLSFIDLLRNRSVALRMGATRLTGLTGNVSIPKQTGAATAYWLSENEAATESQQTIGQISLSPRNVGAYTEISRQLLLQSNPSAEAMVMNDLAQVVGLAVDAAILEGSGNAGAPMGISATSGIGSVTGTSLAAAGVIEFMTDVASANVEPQRPGYVTTAAVAGLLMARPELPSTGTTRLWLGNVWNGSLFGIPAMSSQQLTAATMVFGAWEHAVLAEWGVLEIEVNPYANFQAGIRGVRALYSVDVGIRHAAAFSRAHTIT